MDTGCQSYRRKKISPVDRQDLTSRPISVKTAEQKAWFLPVDRRIPTSRPTSVKVSETEKPEKVFLTGRPTDNDQSTDGDRPVDR